MKKTLLSFAVAAILLSGCGDETATAVTETTQGAVSTATQAVSNGATAVAGTTADAAKATVDATANAAQSVAATATDAAKATVAATTAAASTAVAAATPAATTPVASSGADLFKKCTSCHGDKGQNVALGKSAVINMMSSADIASSLTGYKAGTLNKNGMGALMKGQAATLSDADIKTLSDYIPTLK